MVDVGYFINGKHGVIRKVTPISNTETEHLCFMQVDGEEQYALKKEDIDYVVPSDIDCVGSLYTEEKMIELCQKVDPPMTFAEKFKEVFGYEPNKGRLLCETVNCSCRDSCEGCLYENNNWDEPYVKLEVKN